MQIILVTIGNDFISKGEFVRLPSELSAQYSKLSQEEKEQLNQVLKSRNGLKVEYNETMSAMLGCNTNEEFLLATNKLKKHYVSEVHPLWSTWSNSWSTSPSHRQRLHIA